MFWHSQTIVSRQAQVTDQLKYYSLDGGINHINVYTSLNQLGPEQINNDMVDRVLHYCYS